MKPIRVLLLADTHLGFDYPFRPRVNKPRRGEDFFARYRDALAPALRGEVDLVVHGGDVFFRSRIPEQLVWMGFQPLFEVADAGVPVVVVPGNHERGHIPHGLLAMHRDVHIFHQPGTFEFELHGLRVQIAGFPSERDDIRARMPGLLESTGWRQREADIRLLCVHQAFEGARVHGYTFRHRPDTARMADVPAAFDAVLCGHIHRHQVLTRDLQGRPAPAPVVYPGSVERTAFVERFEEKGYVLLELLPGQVDWRFVRLSARPMEVLEWRAAPPEDLRARLAALPVDAVVQVRVLGAWPAWLGAAWLRQNGGEGRVVSLSRLQLKQ